MSQGTTRPSPSGLAAAPLLAGLAAHPRGSAVLGAGAIAFSGILFRWSGVEPTTATVFRTALALPFLWPLVIAEERRFGPRSRRSRLMALLAGVFFAADLQGFHAAVVYVGAGLGTVIPNSQVVVVTLVTWLLFGERPPGRALAAVPIVLLGVVLISGIVGPGAYGRDPALGAAVGLLSAVAYSAFLIVMRRIGTDRRHVAGPLFDATLATALVALPFGILPGAFDPLPSLSALGILLVYALTSQVIGYLLITSGLPRLPAIVGSILLMVQPVATMALGVVLLGERPSPVQLAGVALVLGGIAFATLPSRRNRRVGGGEPAAGA